MYGDYKAIQKKPNASISQHKLRVNLQLIYIEGLTNYTKPVMIVIG